MSIYVVHITCMSISIFTLSFLRKTSSSIQITSSSEHACEKKLALKGNFISFLQTPILIFELQPHYPSTFEKSVDVDACTD